MGKKWFLKKVLGILAIWSLIPTTFAYINNNAGRPTCVSDNGQYVFYGCIGAQQGMEDSSYINGEAIFYNPTEWLFNDYLKNKEFLFFVWHGNPNSIWWNVSNNFSDDVMTLDELDTDLESKVVTIMACQSLQNFGQRLIDNGVECVVGWNNSLYPWNTTKMLTRPKKFYTCAGWHDPDYCEDYASIQSNLWWSSTKGNCNDFSMNSKTGVGTDPVKVGLQRIKNGELFISYPNTSKWNVSKEISRDTALTKAKNALNIPKDYHLIDEEEKSYWYGFVFARYIDDIKIPSDTYMVYLNKNGGDPYMYRKVQTPNLDNRYIFSSSDTDIAHSLVDVKNITSIEKVLLTESYTTPLKAWEVSYEDKNGLSIVTYLEDWTLKILN